MNSYFPPKCLIIVVQCVSHVSGDVYFAFKWRRGIASLTLPFETIDFFGPAPPTGVPSHVAITVTHNVDLDNSEIKLYYNGTLVNKGVFLYIQLFLKKAWECIWDCASFP